MLSEIAHESVENQIVRILENLLKRPIAEEEHTVSFDQLNLDSLNTAAMIGELENAYGLELDIDIVFECPTIASLARRIESLRARS